MNTVQNLVHAALRLDKDGGYVAVVDEIAIQVRGETLEATVATLRDEILRCAQNDTVTEITLTTGPRLRLILDIELAEPA